MKNNEIYISSFSNFLVRIFVIGYKNEGESNVVLFFDGDNVVFSMIIDCFKKEDLNLAFELLVKYGVEKIDLAFWTHPHDDHSPGFDEIISNFLSPKTIVYLPRFLFSNFDPAVLRSKCVAAQSVYANLEKLNSKRPARNPLLRTIDVNPGDNIFREYVIVDNDKQKKDFVIKFLTPIRPYIEEFGFQGCQQKLVEVNELSISFIMSLDSYDFYFGGDTEKKHANIIDPDIIGNMRWVKVPHHCSKNAKKIAIHLMEERFDCAVSTVYSPRLPKVNIQNDYKSKGRLFMTQLNNKPNLGEYGIVRFDYRFEQDKVKISPFIYGNAYEYQ